MIWLVIPASRTGTDHTNNTLALFILIQYIPRLFLIFPLNQRIQKTTGVIAKTPWIGAAYNLVLYMLASHVSSYFAPFVVSSAVCISNFPVMLHIVIVIEVGQFNVLKMFNLSFVTEYG